MSKFTVHTGDCLEVLKQLPEHSVDAAVTDPPYGLSKEPDIREVLTNWLANTPYKHSSSGFMGNSWDSFVPGPEHWREIFRVLKPGAYLLAFGGTRTIDLLGVSIRLAGFSIRDQIDYIYGKGMPKTHNIYKNMQKKYPEIAEEWRGYGTGLAPRHEPIIVAQKPFLKKYTIVQNAFRWGTGGLNIDDCRTALPEGTDNSTIVRYKAAKAGTAPVYGNHGWEHTNRGGDFDEKAEESANLGRWATNLLFSHGPECKQTGTRLVKARVINRFDDGAKPFGDGAGHEFKTVQTSADGTEEIPVFACDEFCAIKLLDDQTGVLKSGKPAGLKKARKGFSGNICIGLPVTGFGDSGGASRFYPCFEWCGLDAPFLYSNKVEDKERSQGVPEGIDNDHPTMKPVKLLKWLVTLIGRPGATILDPFAGVGSTGMATMLAGMNFVGVELDGAYAEIAKLRIQYAIDNPDQLKKALKLREDP